MIQPSVNTVTITIPELKADLIWKTILFNCYCHTFDEAAGQIMKTMSCNYATAVQLADDAQRAGSVCIYAGSYNECVEKGKILSSTGLEVGITQ